MIDKYIDQLKHESFGPNYVPIHQEIAAQLFTVFHFSSIAYIIVFIYIIGRNLTLKELISL